MQYLTTTCHVSSKAKPLFHPIQLCNLEFNTLSNPFIMRFLSTATKLTQHEKKSSTTTSIRELDDLAQLSGELNQTRSSDQKKMILARHSGCLPLLKRIYNPDEMFNISSAHVKSFLEMQATSEPDKQPTPTAGHVENITDLSSLLTALSSRTLTGNAALSAVARFVTTNCRDDAQRETFYHVLDKNMKMGISVATINSVFPESISTFKVALARTFKDEAELTKILTANKGDVTNWYASRKIDGLRCLTMIQSVDPHVKSEAADWKVQFFSRTGKALVTLGKVEEAIKQFILPLSMDAKDKSVVKAQDFLHNVRDSGGFVLDGEMCVLESGAGDGEDWKENFQLAMQVCRAEGHNVLNPVYFVFDCLTMEEFMSGKGERSFAERLDVLKGLLKMIRSDHVVQVLEQKNLSNKKELESMVSAAMAKGWEGVMLRKNVGYEGKRSRNLLKLKQWDDAEYVVKDVEMGMMRMPDTGIDTKVLTAVFIEHKGNKVGVGSGFSLSQRVRYAERPDLILGKPITVRYFAESKKASKKGKAKDSKGDADVLGSNTEEGVVMSLRFPTVKMVYEEGIKDV